MIYIARSQGDRVFKLGGITGDRSPWRGTKDHLQAWKDGCTGEELVDAGMNELKLTGYMSMRARHIVATYLVYDLEVDWRHGAAHFEEHLLDYDPALNWVMWMQAPGLLGRGGRHQGLLHFSVKKSVDSQRKQLCKHAPDREYIQHWLMSGHGGVAKQSSSGRGSLHKQPASGQRTVFLQGSGPAATSAVDDVDEDLESRAKRWARMKRFSTRSPEHLAEAEASIFGKGNGKHSRGKHANDHSAAEPGKGQKKGRWRRKEECSLQTRLTFAAA